MEIIINGYRINITVEMVFNFVWITCLLYDIYSRYYISNIISIEHQMKMNWYEKQNQLKRII